MAVYGFLFLLCVVAAHNPMLLLRNARVYSPEDMGVKDILVGGSKILGIMQPKTFDATALKQAVDIKVFDLSGYIIVPGFIDLHMHITGGGGEMGPYSRTPEAKLFEIVESGITTLVGTMGTDGTHRKPENVLAKARGLSHHGITAYMYTGAYHVPPPTLTGTVISDIMNIEQVIGIGEVAISDHRSSIPSFEELSRIASDARVGGMLSGKAGIIHLHVGKGKTLLDPIWEIINKTEVPITQFHPTHMSNRGPKLLEEGVNWIKSGGTVDFTADSETKSRSMSAILMYAERGVNMSHVTVSTDAYGSLPTFDASGELVGYDVAKPNTLLFTLRELVLRHNWDMSRALPLITSNPASVLKLHNKGKLGVGFDADLLVFDRDLGLQYVVASGKILKTPDWTVKGLFEE